MDSHRPVRSARPFSSGLLILLVAAALLVPLFFAILLRLFRQESAVEASPHTSGIKSPRWNRDHPALRNARSDSPRRADRAAPAPEPHEHGPVASEQLRMSILESPDVIIVQREPDAEQERTSRAAPRSKSHASTSRRARKAEVMADAQADPARESQSQLDPVVPAPPVLEPATSADRTSNVPATDTNPYVYK